MDSDIEQRMAEADMELWEAEYEEWLMQLAREGDIDAEDRIYG